MTGLRRDDVTCEDMTGDDHLGSYKELLDQHMVVELHNVTMMVKHSPSSVPGSVESVAHFLWARCRTAPHNVTV